MSDIFISYARKDRETAQRLAKALEAEGWSVWWDTRLNAGEVWDDVIARELAAVRCVIVLWSKVSVERNWVRVEAREGLRRRVLVPVRIEDVEPPLEFGRVHVGDLIDWNGHETHPGFRQVVADIADLLGLAAPQPAPSPADKPRPEPAPQPKWLEYVVATVKRIGATIAGWRPRKHHLAVAGGVALLVVAVIVYSCYGPPPPTPEEPPESQEVACYDQETIDSLVNRFRILKEAYDKNLINSLVHTNNKKHLLLCSTGKYQEAVILRIAYTRD